MALPKVRIVVFCNKHGSESKFWDGRQVLVKQPLTKKQRFNAGCPICKKENQNEQV